MTQFSTAMQQQLAELAAIADEAGHTGDAQQLRSLLGDSTGPGVDALEQYVKRHYTGLKVFQQPSHEESGS